MSRSAAVKAGLHGCGVRPPCRTLKTNGFRRPTGASAATPFHKLLNVPDRFGIRIEDTIPGAPVQPSPLMAAILPLE